MQIDVIFHPRDIRDEHRRNRAVVVFDVLRATTTMIAALSAGAKEIRIFSSLEHVRAAACGFAIPKLLCGELRCVRPKGFDLGNSPPEFTRDRVAGKTLFMSTTNGTCAIIAAVGASDVLIAGLVNAQATARYLSQLSRDVTLLCAGTDGEYSIEDSIGAGAVINSLSQFAKINMTDAARATAKEFNQVVTNLPIALRSGAGGKNIIAAGLEADIDFAAKMDSIDRVAGVRLNPLCIVAVNSRGS